MKIQSLAIDGFGGLSEFRSDLSQLTLVTGPNGSGKTMILHAAAIGLIGYCPDLGNKPTLTRGRMSGRIGTIQIRMDGGGTKSLTFPKTGSPTQVVVGAIPAMDPGVLDMSKFFGMTGPQRVKFLLGLASLDIPTVSVVAKTLFEDTFDTHQVPKDQWWPMVKDLFEPFKGKETTLDWLSELYTAALAVKNEVGGLADLRATMARLEAELAPKDGPPPVDQASKIRELDTKINFARNVHLTAAKAVSDMNTRINTLRAEAKNLLKQAEDVPDKTCPTCGARVAGKKKEEHVRESHVRTAGEKEAQAKAMEEQLPPLTADEAKKKGEVDMLVAQLQGIQDQQRKYTQLQGAVLQLDKIRLEIQRLAEKELVMKAIPNWITKYQSSLLDKSLTPICDVASRIVQKRFALEVKVSGGNFVLKSGDALIDLDCASGGERLLATLGIQIALMQRSPFKLIMADELGRVDSKSLLDLLQVVLELIESGVVDQFIGALPVLPPGVQAVLAHHNNFKLIPLKK